GGVEILPETLRQQVWPVERSLHGELLVEQHPDHQRQPVGGEQAVGVLGLGEEELFGHAPNRSLVPLSAGKGERDPAAGAKRRRGQGARTSPPCKAWGKEPPPERSGGGGRGAAVRYPPTRHDRRLHRRRLPDPDGPDRRATRLR